MNKQIRNLYSQRPQPVRPTERLSDLGLPEDLVESLLQLIGLPLLHSEIFKHTNISPPRGILLHGPPGCGKSHLAAALAGELNVPFFPISAPSVVSALSGNAELALRDIFSAAREHAPCIVLLDEVDAITQHRESSKDMNRRIVAQLQVSMDNLDYAKNKYKAVIVIGATNRADSIDPSLRRAGRFDREICIGVPDSECREKIISILVKHLKITMFNVKSIAARTPGFVGADLKALATEAGVIAMKRMLIDLGSPSVKDFLQAFPDSLTESMMEPLNVTFADFETALGIVQPSSTREGFATCPGITWDSIGALHNVRNELLMSVLDPIRCPEKYERMGIRAPTGILLWGPPGCGKTMIAKAIASESHCNFISIKGPELLNKYVGESERAVRNVFYRAKMSAPCVIFFDEIDALAPKRMDSQNESTSRVVNTLLTELDGMELRKKVYVIAATNRPDILDPAILRPGRIDKQLFVDLPDKHERFDILCKLIGKMPINSDVNLLEIAHHVKCTGFSGADLSSLVREAGFCSIQEFGYDAIVYNRHFMEALLKLKASVTNPESYKRF